VVTTQSGLQYLVLKPGDGPKPVKTDKVKVHYRGTTIDGAEFDSSYKRGKPAAFSVTGVIKGWTEALLLMNVGSKYKLFIPSQLAYGQRGAGPGIGPNAVLIFEVELLGIEK
jgi:FKBP-type peptidyl-prolyl cis-trans isomerase FklB